MPEITRRNVLLLAGVAFASGGWTVLPSADPEVEPSQHTPPDIPDEDISWWPAQARPPILAERHFAEFGIGPGKAPAPDALPETYTEVTTQAGLLAAFAAMNPGATIICRAGVYNGPKVISRSGASGNRIKIRVHPDEEQQVIWTNTSWPQFQTAPNNLWEEHDAGKKIWRTVATNFTGAYATGLVQTPDGKLITMVPYINLTTLSATLEGWTGQGTTEKYMGPGVVRHTDGRIYIRLSDVDQAKTFGDFSAWLTDAQRNPNNLKLYLTNLEDNVTIASASHLEFHGIRTIGNGNAFQVNGHTQHLYWLRCQLSSTRMGIRRRLGNADHHHVDYCAIRVHCPQWWPRELHKREPQLYRSRTDSVGIQFVGDSVDGVNTVQTNLHVTNSRITDFQDAIKFSSNTTHNTNTYYNNYIRCIDDGGQCSTASHNIDIAYNFCVGPIWGWQGSTVTAPGAQQGKIFIHHNVIDLRWRMLFNFAPDEDHRVVRMPVHTHNTTISNQTSFSEQIYNNTIIGGGAGGDGDNQAIFQDWFGLSATVKEHWMNNVVVQTDVRGKPFYFHYRTAAQATSCIMDGNLYNRQGAAHDFATFWRTYGGAAKKFATLAAFKADTTWWGYTKGYYTPGWENSGVEVAAIADVFTSFAAGNLQPPVGSPAGSGYVDLTAYPPAANWPENNSPFRGAIAPGGPDSHCSSSLSLWCWKGGWN